jgi:succinate dehydrogenase / fumarate reductase cytochrome b subunit
VHLLGNIKLYLSKEELNLYGEALRDMPGHLLPHTWLLWFFRLGLIGAFFFHIHAAYGLTRINMKARPEKYQSKRDYIAADFASRTMRWTGIIILLYLFFHLADLTWGNANPEFLRGDPYNNLVFSLQRPVVAIAYALAMIALGFHLYHGSWSLFGEWRSPRCSCRSACRQLRSLTECSRRSSLRTTCTSPGAAR